MINYEDFVSQINTLNTEFHARLDDEVNNRYVITDGALNPPKYFEMLCQEEKPRMMWLMKEAYDGDNGTDGYWDYYENFFKDNPCYYDNLVIGDSKPTWQPVVYIVYSVLNEFLLFDNMDWIRDDPSMADTLNLISWVNIQKLPALGGTTSDSYRIYEAYEKCKDLINRQIELLKPHFIFCGGTFNQIKQDFKDIKLNTLGCVDYFQYNGIVYLHAYHPANRSVTRQRYCDDIINVCKSFWDKKEV